MGQRRGQMVLQMQAEKGGEREECLLLRRGVQSENELAGSLLEGPWQRSLNPKSAPAALWIALVRRLPPRLLAGSVPSHVGMEEEYEGAV